MTYTLGLSGFGYNPGCALLKDGKLLSHIEEEKLNGFKGSHFLFPTKSVQWILSSNNLTFNDIHKIGWAWNYHKYKFEMPLEFARLFFKYGFRSECKGPSNIGTVLAQILDFQPGSKRKKIQLALKSTGISGEIPEIQFHDHHLCHAYSAHFCSGYESSTSIVIDGSGEASSTTIYRANNQGVEKLLDIKIPNSLGWFYAAFTEYLGFIPYRDEGKVMGLAPYGKESKEIRDKVCQILWKTNDGYEVDPSFTLLGKHDHGAHFSNRMIEFFGEPRKYGEELSQYHKDLAFAVQYRLEEIALHICEIAYRLAPNDNLTLSGGVALNCKMNGIINQKTKFKNFFVQPSSSDAGSSIGAAMLSCMSLKNEKLLSMSTGVEFTDKEIEFALTNAQVKFSKEENIETRIASALNDNKIIAVFQGKSESGPRALGNRSIIANPMNKEMRDIVNGRVKFRENWRPFCPSMTNDFAKKCLNNFQEGSFMIVAYEMQEEWQDKLPSVVHVDGTVRPQAVDAQEAPFFYKTLKEFEKLSGYPIVLNTSFNIRGKPIVNSPNDALSMFYSSGLDCLAIGNYWVEK